MLTNLPIRSGGLFLSALLFAAAVPVTAQQSPSRGWPRANDNAQSAPAPYPGDNAGYGPSEADEQDAPGPGGPPPSAQGAPYQRPASQYDPRGGYRPYPQQTPANRADGYQPGPPIPPSITVAPGTLVTVRLNNPLSSDHNQTGDAFTATLDQPLVINGVVVAQRGQNVIGHVTAAEKAGLVKGVSKLGVSLDQLVLVDGQQLNIQTTLAERRGNTSIGRDVAAIGTTAAIGAIIGSAADQDRWGNPGGRGAGIGAAAGAGAGLIGVLLTRGEPTFLGPETLLSFRIQTPVTFSTAQSEAAFYYVDRDDYRQQEPPPSYARQFSAPPPPAPYYGPSYYGPAYYGPSYYPYRSSFFFSFGSGYRYRGYGYRPRYYGHYRR